MLYQIGCTRIVRRPHMMIVYYEDSSVARFIVLSDDAPITNVEFRPPLQWIAPESRRLKPQSYPPTVIRER